MKGIDGRGIIRDGRGRIPGTAGKRPSPAAGALVDAGGASYCLSSASYCCSSGATTKARTSRATVDPRSLSRCVTSRFGPKEDAPGRVATTPHPPAKPVFIVVPPNGPSNDPPSIGRRGLCQSRIKPPTGTVRASPRWFAEGCARGRPRLLGSSSADSPSGSSRRAGRRSRWEVSTGLTRPHGRPRAGRRRPGETRATPARFDPGCAPSGRRNRAGLPTRRGPPRGHGSRPRQEARSLPTVGRPGRSVRCSVASASSAGVPGRRCVLGSDLDGRYGGVEGIRCDTVIPRHFRNRAGIALQVRVHPRARGGIHLRGPRLRDVRERLVFRIAGHLHLARDGPVVDVDGRRKRRSRRPGPIRARHSHTPVDSAAKSRSHACSGSPPAGVDAGSSAAQSQRSAVPSSLGRNTSRRPSRGRPRALRRSPRGRRRTPRGRPRTAARPVATRVRHPRLPAIPTCRPPGPWRRRGCPLRPPGTGSTTTRGSSGAGMARASASFASSRSLSGAGKRERGRGSGNGRRTRSSARTNLPGPILIQVAAVPGVSATAFAFRPRPLPRLVFTARDSESASKAGASPGSVPSSASARPDRPTHVRRPHRRQRRPRPGRRRVLRRDRAVPCSPTRTFPVRRPRPRSRRPSA